MFSRTIEFSASKQGFRFVEGTKEIRFRPVVFLAPGTKKFIAIGETPPGLSDSEGIDVFKDAGADLLPFLKATIRYGLRSLSGAFRIRPIIIKISIESDIRAQLKDSAWPIFQHAASEAGATKVVESNETKPEGLTREWRE
jgi:hypothetical protein